VEKFAFFFPQKIEKFAPPKFFLSISWHYNFTKKREIALPPSSFPTTLLVQFTEKNTLQKFT